MCDEWPFDDPKNLAVITLKRIAREGKPILQVFHDEEDGSWQFLDHDSFEIEDALVVALHRMVQIDPTIIELADLPLGGHAWKYKTEEPWQRGFLKSG